MPTNKRLIDAFALTIHLSRKNSKRPLHYDDVLATIADEKTVDAVEVVRCKNCVSAAGNDVKGYMCQNQLCPCYCRDVPDDFSCICGERRAKHEQNQN